MVETLWIPLARLPCGERREKGFVAAGEGSCHLVRWRQRRLRRLTGAAFRSSKRRSLAAERRYAGHPTKDARMPKKPTPPASCPPPPEDDEDPVWGNLFSHIGRPTPKPAPVAEPVAVPTAPDAEDADHEGQGVGQSAPGQKSSSIA